MLQILVLLLDPVSLVLNGIVVFFSRSRWIIPIAALITALIGETVVTEVSLSHSWGEGFAPRLVACFIQAGLIYWIVTHFRRKKLEPTKAVGSEAFKDDAGEQLTTQQNVPSLAQEDKPARIPKTAKELVFLRMHKGFMRLCRLPLQSRPELIAANGSKLIYGLFSYGAFSWLYQKAELPDETEPQRKRRDTIFCRECLPIEKFGIDQEWAFTFYKLLQTSHAHPDIAPLIALGREAVAEYSNASSRSERFDAAFSLFGMLEEHLRERSDASI